MTTLLPFVQEEHPDKWFPKSLEEAEERYKRTGKGSWACYFHVPSMHKTTVHSHVFKQNPDYFSFSFVRNPWERILSLWKWEVYSKGRSLKEFLLDLPKNSYHADFRWNQTHWLKGKAGNIAVDFVGRTERLQEDMCTIFERLGLPGEPDLDLYNLHQDRTTRFDHYDEETREIARALFSDDIQTFGYTFEECTHEA